MVGTMNSEPVRSFRFRRPWRSSLAAALAVTVMLGQGGRTEDDWIVDDAELSALESGPAHMMHGANVQDLQAQFDASILSLFGPVHHQQRIQRVGNRIIRGGGQVVVAGVQMGVNGQQPQAASAADAARKRAKAVERIRFIMGTK